MVEFATGSTTDAAGTLEPPARYFGIKVGRLVEVAAGVAWVDFEGNVGGPRTARTAVELPMPTTPLGEVVLQFEDGDLTRPIIIGVLRPTAVDRLLEDNNRDAPASGQPELNSAAEPDARRHELQARDEVVLRCGKASIVLRRNGRVVIRGAYVETRASGTNRIKGGNVAIN